MAFCGPLQPRASCERHRLVQQILLMCRCQQAWQPSPWLHLPATNAIFCRQSLMLLSCCRDPKFQCLDGKGNMQSSPCCSVPVMKADCFIAGHCNHSFCVQYQQQGTGNVLLSFLIWMPHIFRVAIAVVLLVGIHSRLCIKLQYLNH